MNRLKDCGVLPLTPRESAHRRYREDLKRYKQIYGQYRWDLLVTIRQGKGEQFHSFTNHKDDGYRKREDFAKSFLGRVRCSLSLGKRQFHYCIFHEFGEHLSGHLHIPVQIDAQRPIERIENVLNKEARYWRNNGGYLCHHYYKDTKEILLRSIPQTMDYLCKSEPRAVDSQGYPLSKRPTPSRYLYSDGIRGDAAS